MLETKRATVALTISMAKAGSAPMQTYSEVLTYYLANFRYRLILPSSRYLN